MKKETVLQAINEFPKEVNLNTLFEQLIVKEKIEKGLHQLENGQTVTHADVIAYFSKKWLK
jgi:predicted transcriptional regulator